MRSRIALGLLAASIVAAPALAQQKKTPPPSLKRNTTTYDVVVNADGQAHSGTMTLTVNGGKVSGDMHITTPGEITGKPAGVAKGQALKLDFNYRMVQRGCDGRILMDITMPAKKGETSGTGTVAITGCGRTEAQKLTGTVELKAKK